MLTHAHLHEAAYNAMYAQYYGLMEIREAKDNPMFDPLQTWLTRFIRPTGDEQWRCAACGKKRGRRWFWTQLVPFRASNLGTHAFTITSGPLLDALTPVCSDHPVQPWHEITDPSPEFINPP